MLLELSQVTETLKTLIDQHVNAYLISQTPPNQKPPQVTLSALPPDNLVTPPGPTLGLYLYYISEDAQYKNLPPQSGEVPPVRYTPMGLNLYYQLTAHTDKGLHTDDYPTLDEQKLVGLAMKALHDYPVIDDTTQIGGKQILPTSLQAMNNRFRIVLQPLQHHEAMGYWSAGTQPFRLAVYYQVSVVLLEPVETQSLPGRVLTYGVFSFASGGPRLEGCKSMVSFTPPGAAARQVEVQPAEAPIGAKITFFGSDLAGDQTTLLLKNRRFSDPIEVGMDWGVAATENQIFAVVQSFAETTIIVPGIYSAIAKVTERRLMPDQTLRDFSKTSNETPFVITPLINGFQLNNPILTVTGGIFGTVQPQPAGFVPEAVEVFVGPQRVQPKKVGAILNAGEFEVVDAQNLNVCFPLPELNSGDIVPFRLIVNGAESAPNWVTVP